MDKKKGPNENSGKDLDREPVFYYSREHRLKRASPLVRELNEETPARKGILKSIFPGSFAGLFTIKGNRLLFLAIVFVCVTLFITSRFSGKEQGISLGGNNLSTVIIRDGDVLLLEIIKKAPKRGEKYTGLVDIAVSPVLPKTKKVESNELPSVYPHRVRFSSSETDTFRFSIPFSESEFFVLYRTSDEQKTHKLKVVGRK